MADERPARAVAIAGAARSLSPPLLSLSFSLPATKHAMPSQAGISLSFVRRVAVLHCCLPFQWLPVPRLPPNNRAPQWPLCNQPPLWTPHNSLAGGQIASSCLARFVLSLVLLFFWSMFSYSPTCDFHVPSCSSGVFFFLFLLCSLLSSLGTHPSPPRRPLEAAAMCTNSLEKHTLKGEETPQMHPPEPTVVLGFLVDGRSAASPPRSIG